jgi:N-acetylmuramoyl-L-alanine amidase
MTTLICLAAVCALGVGPGTPAPPAPATIVVATARGESRLPVAMHGDYPALSAEQLEAVLPISHRFDGAWVEVAFADVPFHFLVGAPVFLHEGRAVPLVGGAYVAGDTLFVPLQWLAEFVPRLFREGYRYDPVAARFEEARLQPVATPPPVVLPRLRRPSEAARRRGFRAQHRVVVDAGHGGSDPGNPGLYLPRGVQEKHVTLAISRMLRDQLVARGVEVRMTRDSDTLINLRHRALMCRDDCDLFASIHVNAMPTANQRISGFETYFLGEARTEEARRVAAMENAALRYETGSQAEVDDALAFVFKDLHTNEFLRESADLASAVQRAAAQEHPGGNRGVAQSDRFAVLRVARRPAILIETGFATHRGDGRFLASTEGQRQLARKIADGIEAYLKAYEDRVLGEATP